MKTEILIAAALFAASAYALPNGGIWNDTDGVHINAHGGGLLRDGEVWYWYGEHKVEGKAGNRAQVGVGCYSSRDLVTWKNEGIALKVSNDEGHDIEKDCILERPNSSARGADTTTPARDSPWRTVRPARSSS